MGMRYDENEDQTRGHHELRQSQSRRHLVTRQAHKKHLSAGGHCQPPPFMQLHSPCLECALLLCGRMPFPSLSTSALSLTFPKVT